MQAEAYSNVRNNLKSFMKQVNDNSEAIIITSKNSEDNSVLISKNDYDNLVENAYIRSSTANMDHILKSLKQLKNGNGKEHNWE
ncbi:type II toxin-antitoxin system Phd/YefM family antitoxin [Lactobacillus hominis]|uniref:Antitoxin n=1 Tax=Lactobacillus hominis DSM 23910 = CRBIP 24.179 TaxID=1423758 RepID=I7JV49_9LACO|nr:type II toxin-antitoxin system prevent-host-death family antitoxin [Lactobacillus hominis]MCT3348505.1 type II toxin-antitoxin system prevent-host-death family antitoxin [Lactobacillus hominis]CCI82216.1 Axe [Lactobacillus hominis DSM 23910 = CRBIP 24.179]